MAFKIVLLACVASVAVADPQQFRMNNDGTLSFNPQGANTFNFDLLNNEINTRQQQVPQVPETTTPLIPILRSIDRQNPDGSYTYGYESGDGTYKIETRYATGEVKGKYGYFDDTGLFREVEYGAAPEEGFSSQGAGLDFVAPVETATPAPRRTGVVTSLPQQVIAPTPRPRAVSRPRPILNERTRSNRRDPARDFIARRGRRVKVVKGRKRPSASPKPQPIVRPKSQPLPTPVPTVAPVAAPVQPVVSRQQPVFQNFQPQQQVFQQPQQPAFQPQQPVFQPQQQVFQQQQQVFQPQQRFLPVAQQQLQQPIQPVSLAAAFASHPFISQYNSNNGIFSYSY